MSTNSTVFIGTWTNWSKGQLYGATLTLQTTNAAVLIAALAMFVGFTSAKSWSILSFVIHQFGVTRRPQNGVYHQLQATLRNNGADFETSWEMIKIAWSWSLWRSPRSRSFRRTLGLLILGFLHAIFFAAAGLFSSRLTILGNQVLVRSPNCGQWTPDIITNSTVTLFDYATHLTANAELSAQYVKDCLSNSQSNTQIQSSTECNVFRTLKLPYITIHNVSCPFPNEMCLGPMNGSVTFDTGLLDSSTHLGINTPKRYEVQLRKAMTCSPITTRGFLRNGSITFLDGHSINFTAALYGSQDPPIVFPGVVSELLANSTMIIEKRDIDFVGSVGTQYYTFSSVTAWPVDRDPGFVPIPSIALSDQTVTLMFVSYVGYYLSPSDDLWLPAHQPIVSPTQSPDANTTTNITAYSLDNDVNVLACTEQVQICNPNRGSDEVRCTPMLAENLLDDLYINANNSGYLQNVLDNEQQLTTASLTMYALDWAHLSNVLTSSNQPPLLLNSLQYQQATLGLAGDQWVQESDHLFSLSLNTLQRYVAEFATGPPAPYSHYLYDWVADNPTFEFLCNSQIIRSPNFTSFSIVSISLIFGFGGLTIWVSLWLETIVAYFQGKWKKGLFQQVRWRLDGLLQLQRIGFEEAGLGVWEGGTDEIPTTVEKRQKMALPQSWDEEHPSLFLKGKRTRSTTNGSIASVQSDVGEFGDDTKILLKNKGGHV